MCKKTKKTFKNSKRTAKHQKTYWVVKLLNIGFIWGKPNCKTKEKSLQHLMFLS